ncbi:hypothetical protein J6590_097939 [Homalodisca vitripennis]|nr:hypothetical protein J6590_097939 [Homalodisca vitripennis]
MADDNEPEVPVKIRKCVKQVRYKSELIKEARVKGESYTNWKGNRVERKRKGEDFHDIERRRQVSATNPKPRAHSYTYRVSCVRKPFHSHSWHNRNASTLFVQSIVDWQVPSRSSG